MRRLTIVAAVLALVLSAGVSMAQQQTGNIVGRVTDNSGAVLPGVTVTVSGPALIQPRVLTTSETGSYRAPDLPIGSYTVKFELAGFRTVVSQDIRLTIGFTAELNAALEVSAVEETITVTGESPIVDTKTTCTKTAFDLDTLQNIPSARDPWVMLERTPGIAMDRVNVAGTQSGQQSGYVSRGSGSANNKWAIDGVDITDMSATGASPIYYDFDMLQEMQVTTGGADASQQTGGVGINFVTRSGSDRFFNEQGLLSASLTADSPDQVRRTVQDQLRSRTINFIFVVDLYNEGVDIPEVDTLLFLRPTESLTVYLQQFGRGLRQYDGKECLTVLDFIGAQRREFRFASRYRALSTKPAGRLDREIEQGFPHLPSGCFIQLERVAQQRVLDNVRESVRLLRPRMVGSLRDLGRYLGRSPSIGEALDYFDTTLDELCPFQPRLFLLPHRLNV